MRGNKRKSGHSGTYGGGPHEERSQATVEVTLNVVAEW